MSSHLKTNCRKQKRNCKKQKGISGIGTLIIFIALILVAAVAAIVLLQTSESLQSRAVATGKESEQQVSTKLQPNYKANPITRPSFMEWGCYTPEKISGIWPSPT